MTAPNSADSAQSCCSLWTCAAALVALVALGGSLYLSLGMDLKACPLCFYQRTFVMGVVGVLVVGMTAGGGGRILSLVALPMAVGGLTVAGFHAYREMSGAMECPQGVAGMGSAPQQSLAAHIVLTLLLLADVVVQRKVLPALVAIVLGGALAVGAIKTVPASSVPDYTKPVDQDMCRPKN
jgi:disulfide bond formation protein DsbB